MDYFVTITFEGGVKLQISPMWYTLKTWSYLGLFCDNYLPLACGLLYDTFLLILAEFDDVASANITC